MTYPTTPRGNLVTPVAYDVNGALKPVLVAADGSLNVYITGGINPVPSVAILHDEKSAGSSGGTFTSGAWQTRDINTEVFDPDSIVSISSNQFTLISGKYLIEWSAPALQCGGNLSRLYNVTGSSVICYGSTEYSNPASASDAVRSVGSGYVSITTSTTYRIEHYCLSTVATYGFGGDGNYGVNNVFTIVKILRIGD